MAGQRTQPADRLENALNYNEIQDYGLAIDHLLIGTPELALGCQYISELFGTEPVFGGVHPGIGTCNALLGLEDDVYIEIIAPDPEQTADLPLAKYLRGLKQTALMWWAVRCHDFDALAERLQQNDVEVLSRQPGSRRLPDGRELLWELLIPGSAEFQAAIPFFIEWNDMALHPSRTLPVCGALNSMQVSHPASGKLQQILGSCFKAGHGSGKSLQAGLTIGGNILHLTTADKFPPGMAEFN